MQVNDDNENEDGIVEGLVDLGAANPYLNAPIHQEREFLHKQIVNGTNFEESMLLVPFPTCKGAYGALEAQSFVDCKLNGIFQLRRFGN